MIKKLQVMVKEVYEQEEIQRQWIHIETGEEMADYTYKNLDENDREKKEDYVRKEIPTGKMERLEGDDVYEQVFEVGDLDMKDLILHLNRTK